MLSRKALPSCYGPFQLSARGCGDSPRGTGRDLAVERADAEEATRRAQRHSRQVEDQRAEAAGRPLRRSGTTGHAETGDGPADPGEGGPKLNAGARLAATLLDLDRQLERALLVAGTCREQYAVAPPAVRRLINQGFFVKLFIGDDGSVERAELTEPFAALLAADAVEAIAAVQAEVAEVAEGAQRATEGGADEASEAQSAAPDGLARARPSAVLERTFGSGGEGPTSNTAPDTWGGVHKRDVVPPTGFEPVLPP